MSSTKLKLLPYELTGPNSSNTLVVFIHGFPDSIQLWDNYHERYSKQGHQVLRLSYPNYSDKEYEPWGITLDETARLFKNTLDLINPSNTKKVLLIGHDWGALFCFLFDKANQGYASDIIILDATYRQDKSFKAMFIVLLFQCFLAICFLMPGIIGNCMNKCFLKNITTEI